jgi:hypothetical protein
MIRPQPKRSRLAAVALIITALACSDSGGKKDGTGDDTPDGPSGGGGALTIVFNPMYSAYDDGVHEFKVPVQVTGATGKLTVTTSPANFVTTEPSAAGVMLITRMAGTATVTIQDASGNVGTAKLTVTKNDARDVDVGRERYANGIDAINLPEGGIAALDGGISGIARNEMGACTFCHIPDGQQAMGTMDVMRVDVEHTPQQTAGFSDEDLIKIFSEGVKPEGASYRVVNGGGMLSDQVAATIYKTFHKWSVDPQTRVGIVAYLRSLTPKAQGFIDFGGLRPPAAMGPPVEPDPSCPKIAGLGGQNLPGCCTEGMCGVDASNFGMGCVELGRAAAQAMMAGFGLTFPAAQACGGM